MTEDRDRAEMQRLLAYANFSKVAEAIGVKRAAVANWAAGRHVTPARQVRALYGLPVTPEGQQEKSPPAWAEGLARMSAEEAITRLVRPDLLDAAQISVGVTKLSSCAQRSPSWMNPAAAPRHAVRQDVAGIRTPRLSLADLR